jgi:predicted GIY-YIG superfamily endonuclease
MLNSLKTEKPSFVYLLESSSGGTYVGATIDPIRRLEQHNGLRSGGAKATRGCTWKRIYLVGEFPDETAALQFEWKWKALSKSMSGSPIERRKKALDKLINSEKSTHNSIPFSTYVSPLSIIYEGLND